MRRGRGAALCLSGQSAQKGPQREEEAGPARGLRRHQGALIRADAVRFPGLRERSPLGENERNVLALLHKEMFSRHCLLCSSPLTC